MFHVNAGGTAGEAYSIEVLTIATSERRKITDGMYPLYAAGHLIFIRSNNSVWSIPFDVDRAEPSGSLAPIPLNIFRRAGDYHSRWEITELWSISRDSVSRKYADVGGRSRE